MHAPTASGPQSQSFHGRPHPPFSNPTCLPQQTAFFPPPGPAFALAHNGARYWGIVVSSRNFGKAAICQVDSGTRTRELVEGPSVL